MLLLHSNRPKAQVIGQGGESVPMTEKEIDTIARVSAMYTLAAIRDATEMAFNMYPLGGPHEEKRKFYVEVRDFFGCAVGSLETDEVEMPHELDKDYDDAKRLHAHFIQETEE